MLHMIKTMHRLNLFMKSDLSQPQKILMKFQSASLIDGGTNSDESSDNLIDFFHQDSKSKLNTEL